MKKLMIVLVLFSSSLLAVPIHPEIKASMARGAINSCMEHETKDGAVRDYGIKYVTEFCNCYAKEIVNDITSDDVDFSIKNGRPSDSMQLNMTASVVRCTALLGKASTKR